MNDLIKKTVLITGGSGGIGKALAFVLAREGMNLVLAARTKSTLKKTADEIGNTTGVRVVPVVTDVTKKKSLENLIAQGKKAFGRIDVLINGAGISSQHPFNRQPSGDIERLINTNFYGCVMCTRLVIPHMIQNKSGTIINILSGSVLVAPPPRNFLVYTSLKVGLRAFSKGLFWELRDHNIKVTSLMPGVTQTPLTGALDRKSLSSSRLMTTEAIGQAVLFALRCPRDVCPLEVAVINQKTPWTKPVIPFKQKHPKK
jgi:3-oxoacyl-[acyl-carrier protein] reductase